MTGKHFARNLRIAGLVRAGQPESSQSVREQKETESQNQDYLEHAASIDHCGQCTKAARHDLLHSWNKNECSLTPVRQELLPATQLRSR